MRIKADKLRGQVRQIVVNALLEMGLTVTEEQLQVLVSGYLGLACLATAEYRRAKAMRGPGPGAVDQMYKKDETKGAP